MTYGNDSDTNQMAALADEPDTEMDSDHRDAIRVVLTRLADKAASAERRFIVGDQRNAAVADAEIDAMNEIEYILEGTF
jgi:hypothetical protein